MNHINIYWKDEELCVFFRTGKSCIYSYVEGQEFIEKEILKYQRKMRYLKKEDPRDIGGNGAKDIELALKGTKMK